MWPDSHTRDGGGDEGQGQLKYFLYDCGLIVTPGVNLEVRDKNNLSTLYMFVARSRTNVLERTANPN